MKPDLKPCPFCGERVYFDRLHYNSHCEDCIVCVSCECVFTTDYIEPSKEDLAEAWNRRAGDEDT